MNPGFRCFKHQNAGPPLTDPYYLPRLNSRETAAAGAEPRSPKDGPSTTQALYAGPPVPKPPGLAAGACPFQPTVAHMRPTGSAPLPSNTHVYKRTLTYLHTHIQAHTDTHRHKQTRSTCKHTLSALTHMHLTHTTYTLYLESCMDRSMSRSREMNSSRRTISYRNTHMQAAMSTCAGSQIHMHIAYAHAAINTCA